MRNIMGTALSVAEWATFLGLNKWIMAQFKIQSTSTNKPMYSEHRPADYICDDVWFERIHHNGKPSRFEVNRALLDAEEAFARVMGFFPAPTYTTIELDYPGHWHKQIHSRGFEWNLRGRPKEVTLPFKDIIELGTPTETLTANNHALDRSPVAGIPDYLISSAAITIPDTVQDWQIVARYPLDSADAENNLSIFADQSEWEIRPLRIITDSVNPMAETRDIRIAFPAYCGVRPGYWDVNFPQPLVADDTSVYLTAVDVFYVETDTCFQGKFKWNGLDCKVTEATACFNIQNASRGTVAPLEIDPCAVEPVVLEACNANGRAPDKVEINYLSGVPRRPNGQMDWMYGQMVAWLAAGRLQCQPCGCGCGCDNCKDGFGRQQPLWWFSEVAVVDGINATFLAHSRKEMSNPFGPTNGDVKAWKIAQDKSKKDMGVPFD